MCISVVSVLPLDLGKQGLCTFSRTLSFWNALLDRKFPEPRIIQDQQCWLGGVLSQN